MYCCCTPTVAVPFFSPLVSSTPPAPRSGHPSCPRHSRAHRPGTSSASHFARHSRCCNASGLELTTMLRDRPTQFFRAHPGHQTSAHQRRRRPPLTGSYRPLNRGAIPDRSARRTPLGPAVNPYAVSRGHRGRVDVPTSTTCSVSPRPHPPNHAQHAPTPPATPQPTTPTPQITNYACNTRSGGATESAVQRLPGTKSHQRPSA